MLHSFNNLSLKQTFRSFSRPVLTDLDAVFIHVPKTGGVSIDRFLKNECSLTGFTGHYPASYIKETNPEIFESSFKFSFVRNPWDRLVSAFHFMSQGGYSKIDKVIYQNHIAQYEGDFNRFVLELPNKSNFVYPNEPLTEFYADGLPYDTSHFLAQTFWLCDSNNNILVDFVGRFEDLDRDFDKVCAHIGLRSAQLELSNKSNHDHYRNYYTSETAAIVASLYQSDIENFGYTF